MESAIERVFLFFQLWALGQLYRHQHIRMAGLAEELVIASLFLPLGWYLLVCDKIAFPLTARQWLSSALEVPYHVKLNTRNWGKDLVPCEDCSWATVRRQWGVALQGFPSSVLCSLEQGLALQPDVTVLLPCADLAPPPLLGFFLLPGHRMTTEGAGDSYLHLSITLDSDRIVNAFQG